MLVPESVSAPAPGTLANFTACKLLPSAASPSGAVVSTVMISVSPARVISSPLRRCVDTAAAFGVEVEVDDRWIELDYGEYDRTPIGEVPADVWQRWRSDLDFHPPGGESIAQLGARVRSALDELVDDDAAREHDIVPVPCGNLVALRPGRMQPQQNRRFHACER